MEMESKDEKLLQILRDPETQFASLQVIPIKIFFKQ